MRFATAHGARLAYQTWGTGDAWVVAIPPLAQNIEVAWEWPAIRAMLERFGSFCRYLHFDKRGTGSSDRRSRMPGIDERVEDVRAVMDDAGIETAHLFVQSDGGPMAIMFAATYPDRVLSLTFFGSGACLAPPWTEEQRIAARERQATEWGTPNSRMIDFFAPSQAADQEYRTWHQRYERTAATADSLRDLLDLIAEMDVREVLPHIDVPALVIHRTGDRSVPIDLGRELAESIPGARLLELEGDDHFAYVGELEPWMVEVERMVTGTVSAPRQIAPPATTRITTLGEFVVERDGAAIATAAWGSRRARLLCKRLVAARGWPVTRDELIDMLWPGETDMRRLGARLSVQLSLVRRVLGGGVIADRESLRLDLDEVSTDLEDFHRATDDAAIAAAYAGEFLPEDVYEDWAAPVRDEARARYVGALRRRLAREQSQGGRSAAAAHARSLIEADRYDEGAHRALVGALIAAGQLEDARRAHEAMRAAMSEIDVAVEPFHDQADS